MLDCQIDCPIPTVKKELTECNPIRTLKYRVSGPNLSANALNTMLLFLRQSQEKRVITTAWSFRGSRATWMALKDELPGYLDCVKDRRNTHLEVPPQQHSNHPLSQLRYVQDRLWDSRREARFCPSCIVLPLKTLLLLAMVSNSPYNVSRRINTSWGVRVELHWVNPEESMGSRQCQQTVARIV